MKIMKFIVIAVSLLGLAGCASAGKNYTWQDIKQEVGPVVPKPDTMAYLKVYTKVEEVNDDGYLWTRGKPYTIFSAEGKKIQWVRNSDGTPDLVTLPPGKYVIVPDSWNDKNEITGADLVQGKLTEVHMMGG